jgi:hypothetical protein
MKPEQQQRRVRLRLGGGSVKQSGRGSVLKQKLFVISGSWSVKWQRNDGSKNGRSVVLVVQLRTLSMPLHELYTSPNRAHHRRHRVGGDRGHETIPHLLLNSTKVELAQLKAKLQSQHLSQRYQTPFLKCAT